MAQAVRARDDPRAEGGAAKLVLGVGGDALPGLLERVDVGDVGERELGSWAAPSCTIGICKRRQRPSAARVALGACRAAASASGVTSSTAAITGLPAAPAVDWSRLSLTRSRRVAASVVSIVGTSLPSAFRLSTARVRRSMNASLMTPAFLSSSS